MRQSYVNFVVSWVSLIVLSLTNLTELANRQNLFGNSDARSDESGSEK